MGYFEAKKNNCMIKNASSNSLETKYDKIDKALGYFEAKDEQQHDIRSSSLSQNMKNMKPRNHERQ